MANALIKDSEKNIQAAILQYLSLRGIFHWRNNSGAFTIPESGNHARRYIKMGITGAPDIICVIKGRFVGIEVKGPKGKQRPDQIDYEQRCIKAGGIYYVARSIDQAIEFIEDAYDRLEWPKF